MPGSDARWARWTTTAASVLGGAALWELGARGVSPAVVAPFSASMERLVEMLRTGELGAGVAGSLALFFAGLGLALVTALPFGLLLARAPLVRAALSDAILLLYAMPMVALIPFILSLMGFGFAPKVLVVFLFAVFPILYNTVEGSDPLELADRRDTPKSSDPVSG